MKCKNCNNSLDADVKFCGKCGLKVEQELSPETTKEITGEDQEKLIREVKSVGNFFKIFGYIKVIFGGVIVFLLATNSDALEFISLGYSNVAFTIIIGVLWIILGGRVAKNVDKDSKNYLRVIFWILIAQFLIGFFTTVVANTESGTRHAPSIIPVLFAIYANKGLKKLKLINPK